MIERDNWSATFVYILKSRWERGDCVMEIGWVDTKLLVFEEWRDFGEISVVIIKEVTWLLGEAWTYLLMHVAKDIWYKNVHMCSYNLHDCRVPLGARVFEWLAGH